MKLFKELCNEIFDMNINVIIGKIKVNKNGKMNKEKQKILIYGLILFIISAIILQMNFSGLYEDLIIYILIFIVLLGYVLKNRRREQNTFVFKMILFASMLVLLVNITSFLSLFSFENILTTLYALILIILNYISLFVTLITSLSHLIEMYDLQVKSLATSLEIEDPNIKDKALKDVIQKNIDEQNKL